MKFKKIIDYLFIGIVTYAATTSITKSIDKLTKTIQTSKSSKADAVEIDSELEKKIKFAVPDGDVDANNDGIPDLYIKWKGKKYVLYGIE